MSLRTALADWYETRIEPGFWRSWSWRAALSGLGVAVGPDAVNLVLEQWSAIAALPVLSLRTKFWLCVAALVLVVVLRPLQQSSMPARVEAVARFLVPRVVEVVTQQGRRVQVAAQVVPIEPHDPRLDDPVNWPNLTSKARSS